MVGFFNKMGCENEGNDSGKLGTWILDCTTEAEILVFSLLVDHDSLVEYLE